MANASVVQALIALRKERGVTQVELAARMNKRQQFVSLVESGDRRISVVEFLVIVRALGGDPFATLAGLLDKLPRDLQI